MYTVLIMYHTLLPCLTYINSFNCVLEAYIKAGIVRGNRCRSYFVSLEYDEFPARRKGLGQGLRDKVEPNGPFLGPIHFSA